MVEWRTETAPVDYPTALATMDARAADIAAGRAGEWVWLLEHPPLYTAGTGARASDLLTPGALPVYETGRGGEYTYHGPGQRIAYVQLDLNRRDRDLRDYVRRLEAWIAAALAELGVMGVRREGRVGVWVPRTATVDDKIAAIGVRVRRWVTLHGVSINVAPDLSHYSGIVPCGVLDHGVTSLRALGNSASMDDLDRALKATFDAVFEPQSRILDQNDMGMAPSPNPIDR
jgi:lipoyl(octanoyl) transferase